jgi:signal transduction histidine kinase
MDHFNINSKYRAIEMLKVIVVSILLGFFVLILDGILDGVLFPETDSVVFWDNGAFTDFVLRRLWFFLFPIVGLMFWLLMIKNKIDIKKLRTLEDVQKSMLKSYGQPLFILDVKSNEFIFANSAFFKLLDINYSLSLNLENYKVKNTKKLRNIDSLDYGKEIYIENWRDSKENEIQLEIFRSTTVFEQKVVALYLILSAIAINNSPQSVIDLKENKTTKNKDLVEFQEHINLISHDINNYITIILNYSELMLEDLQHRIITKDYIKNLIQTTSNLANLTQKLKSNPKNLASQIKQIEINEKVKNILKLINDTFRVEVKIKTSLDNTIRPISVDEDDFNRSIINLIKNAYEAIEGDGEINISTKEVLDELIRYNVLTIEDNGIGMDENTKKHLFEPFYTTKETGTGLGLINVYSFVNRYNGRINIDSVKGRGTIVEIKLPVNQEAEI